MKPKNVLIFRLQVLEVYGISAVVNSVLILYHFENNDTAYTDNPVAVLFGVAILLFMRKHNFFKQ
jgi:hypothetical protein